MIMMMVTTTTTMMMKMVTAMIMMVMLTTALALAVLSWTHVNLVLNVTLEQAGHLQESLSLRMLVRVALEVVARHTWQNQFDALHFLLRLGFKLLPSPLLLHREVPLSIYL